jgi:hypothetical protein
MYKKRKQMFKTKGTHKITSDASPLVETDAIGNLGSTINRIKETD